MNLRVKSPWVTFIDVEGNTVRTPKVYQVYADKNQCRKMEMHSKYVDYCVVDIEINSKGKESLDTEAAKPDPEYVIQEVLGNGV